MKVENPAALHFMLQDDVFFLKRDKDQYNVVNVPEVPLPPVALVTNEAKTLEETVTVMLPPPVVFRHLGKNKKNLLVIVHYADTEFIADAHLTALENILKRKGFEIDDVAILNRANHDAADFTALTNHFNPQKILLLGENALPAGMETINLNEPKQIAGATALYSFSFDEMMDSSELKKAFWEQMKTL